MYTLAPQVLSDSRGRQLSPVTLRKWLCVEATSKSRAGFQKGSTHRAFLCVKAFLHPRPLNSCWFFPADDKHPAAHLPTVPILGKLATITL